jgi:chemotaxis protein MotB
VQQQSTDTTRMSLDVRSKPPGAAETTADPDVAESVMLEVLRRESEETARTLSDALEKEISSGKVEVKSGAGSVTIRIRERGSFPSGSSKFDAEFLPVMAKLRGTLKSVDGDIAVEGHTDDIPINTEQFRSNWDLSAQRALSVAHELFKEEDINPARFMVVGFADTRPLAPNDDWKNRARNRRVEIVIRRGLDDASPANIEELTNGQADLVGAAGPGGPETVAVGPEPVDGHGP